MTKSCTIALGANSVWKVKSGPTIPQKRTRKVTELMVNNLTVNSSESSHDKTNIRKALEPKYVDFTTAIPRFPMANIAIDLLGPYLPTSKGTAN